MAVFSNLEGTMKKSFILGKNGAKLSTDGDVLQIQNYQGTRLIPISAGDPVANTHLVTLSYFNQHNNAGSGNTLRGSSIPAQSLGVDGDTYFQVDATKIIQIFIKDLGIWKPFLGGPTPGNDSDYVTAITVNASDFTLIPGTSDYTYSIPESTHQRGFDVLIQIQDPTGNSVSLQTEVDGIGNITLTSFGPLDLPYIVVKLIGATSMTTPFSKLVNKSEWVANADKYNLSIPASEHGQEPGPLYLAIYENTVDGSTSSAPYILVAADSTIDSNGNVVFTAYSSFSGKVVISGK